MALSFDGTSAPTQGADAAVDSTGITVTLPSDTAAAPTFTPTQPGYYTVTCTATINGASVVATPDTFLVGDGLPRVRTSAAAVRRTYP